MANTARLNTDEFDHLERCELGLQMKKDQIDFALKEGIAKGKAEGRAEATLESIQNMLDNNLSWDMIFKITGISEKEYLKIGK